MLNSKSFLAVDFGAGSLKLAEFEQNEAGGLRLKQYGIKPLGIGRLAGGQPRGGHAQGLAGVAGGEKLRLAPEQCLRARFSCFLQIRQAAAGGHFQGDADHPLRGAAKCALPAGRGGVGLSNPGHLGHQRAGGAAGGGQSRKLSRACSGSAKAAGLRIKLVDVSSAALCNAFRYNYGDVEGCSMLLDIGAKTSNLLFFEKGKVYSRSINIGANSITQDFAHEAKMRFPEAEATKLEKGSVSLGGAYEEPEDPQAAAIAKIARQVMTRLHIQVNQTIQFYRGQQGGSAPERLYLSGGASIMPYTAQFFAEKLNLPVDYFNPFRNIEIGPALDLEELSKYAHSFGEVVGLGLRDLAHCPVELNLMPKSSIQRQEFAQKKPYLIAAIFSLALAVFLLHQAEARLFYIREGRVATGRRRWKA